MQSNGQVMTIQPVNTTPVATTSAGGWMQQGNALLNNALNAWAQVEQIKAAKSASGGDQVAKQMQPELQNGAGVQLDTTAQDIAKQKAAGVTGFGEINYKMLAFASGALALGLILKAKGFK